MRKALFLNIVTLLLLVQTGCSSLPSRQGIEPSIGIESTESTSLGKFSSLLNENVSADEEAYIPLMNGHDALVARLSMIQHAEKSIDVQYYLYHNDTAGRLLTQYLLEAARRGVRVRMLIDDMATSWRDEEFAIVDSHPNIEVRLYNPFAVRGAFRFTQFISDFSRVNHRMHNKALIADNQVAIIGGRNIGDEYFSHGGVQFSDMDMLVTQPATRKLSRVFDNYWNSEYVYPIDMLVNTQGLTSKRRNKLQNTLEYSLMAPEATTYIEALKSSSFYAQVQAEKLQWFEGKVDVFADVPDKFLQSKNEDHLIALLKPSLDAAKKSLFIISPYFVPGDKGVAYLAQKVQQGVEVSVVTNSLAATDVRSVHAGYSRYRKRLLKAGVKIYELKSHVEKSGKSILGSNKSSLHAKTYVVDESVTFVGSMNLDPRSMDINTETGVIFNDPILAQYLVDKIGQNSTGIYWTLKLQNGNIGWYESTNKTNIPDYTAEPQTGFLARCWIGFLGLLPIESQL